MCIGTRNYVDVPCISEYIHRDVCTVSTSDKHIAFVSYFPYSEIVGSLLYLGVVLDWISCMLLVY